MNTLREAVGEYLDMRRGLGFKLQEAGRGLIDFITFLEQHNASYITQALALAWAQQPPNVQPAYWAQRLSFVREFARYRSATDRRTQIPLQGLLPFQAKRARPYLYSDEEIRSLLRAALRMPCRFERGKLRPWVYYCLFGLLSVSGLRLGEARNLELQDADLKAAVLTIRGAKFGKTRLVPLHASTCTVLADYIARREADSGFARSSAADAEEHVLDRRRVGRIALMGILGAHLQQYRRVHGAGVEQQSGKLDSDYVGYRHRHYPVVRH
jgi:integrase/recombinase XerD